jgi:hypothetical protein
MLRGLKKNKYSWDICQTYQKKKFKKINVEKITFYIFKILNPRILK